MPSCLLCPSPTSSMPLTLPGLIARAIVELPRSDFVTVEKAHVVVRIFASFIAGLANLTLHVAHFVSGVVGDGRN